MKPTVFYMYENPIESVHVMHYARYENHTLKETLKMITTDMAAVHKFN